ncbi:MAG: SMI1/KNR4 family protein [Polyangiaceae bacterium]|nr:SMI1/KNR4 family protein [Polyangiaceae bacterium]MCL4756188.1 SMI1/KNR4 family protein [Myxococcales bacterium]
MADFRILLRDIQRVQREILRIAPYRDFGLKPNPAATGAAIVAAEQRLGRALPPSYREFLMLHDGWSRFYDGATLLGAASLGQRVHADAARATFEAAETPVPDYGPPSRTRPRLLIPFGIDPGATTLFVFNPANVDARGEMEVIAWINEIGLRRSSFRDFLEMICELCQAELDSSRDRVSP